MDISCPLVCAHPIGQKLNAKVSTSPRYGVDEAQAGTVVAAIPATASAAKPAAFISTSSIGRVVGADRQGAAGKSQGEMHRQIFVRRRIALGVVGEACRRDVSIR